MMAFKLYFYIFLNLTFSLLIILLNKHIYHFHIFPNVSLTLLHFVVTFLGLCVCNRLNIFNTKSVNLNSIFVLALCFCGFVIFTNLSLEYNSVGVFQVAKMLTTPGVVLIQMLYYKKTFPLPVKLTLLPIIIGVIVTFYYDITFNAVGTLFAILGVITTSVYQVLVNVKQSELQLNSMQLLYYQAPLSAVMLCFCIPAVEPHFVEMNRHWMWSDASYIIASTLVAFFVNLTTYWIIGNTSPLTYNMLGHTKFILIAVGGWYWFNEQLCLNQWLGIAVTFSGIVLYSHLKMKLERKTKLPDGPLKG